MQTPWMPFGRVATMWRASILVGACSKDEIMWWEAGAISCQIRRHRKSVASMRTLSSMETWRMFCARKFYLAANSPLQIFLCLRMRLGKWSITKLGQHPWTSQDQRARPQRSSNKLHKNRYDSALFYDKAILILFISKVTAALPNARKTRCFSSSFGFFWWLFGLKGSIAHLSCANIGRLGYLGNKNLSVSNFICMGRLMYHLNNAICLPILYNWFKSNFRYKFNYILCTAIDFRLPFLSTEPLRLGHGWFMNANFQQTLSHGI